MSLLIYHIALLLLFIPVKTYSVTPLLAGSLAQKILFSRK